MCAGDVAGSHFELCFFSRSAFRAEAASRRYSMVTPSSRRNWVETAPPFWGASHCTADETICTSSVLSLVYACSRLHLSVHWCAISCTGSIPKLLRSGLFASAQRPAIINSGSWMPALFSLSRDECVVWPSAAKDRGVDRWDISILLLFDVPSAGHNTKTRLHLLGYRDEQNNSNTACRAGGCGSCRAVAVRRAAG